ncbi:MAG: hypothetical protein HY548_04140 [Elusimicrobia bacterium]|nr:hypothetical protein [Elusimicrobiota bacterium]
MGSLSRFLKGIEFGDILKVAAWVLAGAFLAGSLFSSTAIPEIKKPMKSTVSQKDVEQDTQIAVIFSKLDGMDKKLDMAIALLKK